MTVTVGSLAISNIPWTHDPPLWALVVRFNRQTTANTQGVCGRIRFQHVVVYRMAGLTHGKCGLHACGVWSVTDWA